MSINRYANIAKNKRVIAPNASSMLPLKEACIQNTKCVDSGASKKSKSQRCIKQNITNSHSNGPRRKLFIADEDNDEDDNSTSQGKYALVSNFYIYYL